MLKNNVISTWQTAILIFILLFANKILLLPSLLYEQSGILSFLLLFFLFALEFFVLYLFFRLKKKFPYVSFSQILQNGCGKLWRAFCYVLLMLFFLAKTILLYNITYIFFTTTVYREGSNLLYLICFLPVVIYLGVKGLRVLGRTAQLFFPVILAVILLCVVVGFFGIDGWPLLNDTSAGKYFMALFKHLAAFGDVVFLFIFIDKIEVKKGGWKVIFSLAGLAALLVFLVCAVFNFSFTYTAYAHPFAIFEILSYIKEYAGIGRIDIIAMLVVIVLTYFQLAIYFVAFLQCARDLFKVRDAYPTIAFFLAFLLIITYFVHNLEQGVIFGEYLSPFFAAVAFVLLPISILVILSRRKE